jgi:uncharacterized protein (TIGR02284 family)
VSSDCAAVPSLNLCLVYSSVNLSALISAATSREETQKCVLMRIRGMAQEKEIISTINGLIETLKDGQEGFRQAAEAVQNPELKSLFNEYSMQRSRFAGELQNEAISLGEHKPEDSSSAAGALHRTWINLKSAITSKDEHAILAECERGEDSAVKEYRDAMEKEELSLPVRDIVSRQFTEVKNAHDRIKQLRDATKN